MLRLSASLATRLRSKCLRNLSTTSSNFEPTATSSQESTLSKEPREVQIPVPWGHISGKLWGSPTAQPVLGLHGWQDNANSFDGLAPLLEVDAFLAIDTVGHGRSSHYPIGQCYHYIDEIVNIRRIVRHFGWDKVTIVGHSIGSSYGFAYAGYFPDGVDKLVSIDCIRGAIRQGATVADVRGALESNLHVERRLRDPPPVYTYDEITDLYMKGTRGSLTRESCAVLFERGLVKRGDDAYSFSRDPRLKMFTLGFWNEEFLAAIAAQVTCEVLNVRALGGFSARGEAERILNATLALMEASAKRFESHDVEGTHHVHLNEPEKVARIINAFLRPAVPAPAKLY